MQKTSNVIEIMNAGSPGAGLSRVGHIRDGMGSRAADEWAHRVPARAPRGFAITTDQPSGTAARDRRRVTFQAVAVLSGCDEFAGARWRAVEMPEWRIGDGWVRDVLSRPPSRGGAPCAECARRLPGGAGRRAGGLPRGLPTVPRRLRAGRRVGQGRGGAHGAQRASGGAASGQASAPGASGRIPAERRGYGDRSGSAGRAPSRPGPFAAAVGCSAGDAARGHELRGDRRGARGQGWARWDSAQKSRVRASKGDGT